MKKQSITDRFIPKNDKGKYVVEDSITRMRLKEHIAETECRYVYSKTINVIETLELNNEELIKLLEILERTDK